MGVTVISLDTCDSQFSARWSSRCPPTFRDRTEDYKEKAQLNLELCTNRRKIKIKGRMKILVRSQILRLILAKNHFCGHNTYLCIICTHHYYKNITFIWLLLLALHLYLCFKSAPPSILSDAPQLIFGFNL